MSYYWFLAIAYPVLIFGQVVQPASENTTVIIVGQIAILITTLAGFAIQIYRENRARKWAKEDAEALAKKVEATAKETAIETEKIVRHVGNNVSQQVANKAVEADLKREVIEAKLDLNTELTKIAVNGPGKHLYENPDGSPKPLEVRVVSNEDIKKKTE
jgi:hypothetical protein